MESIRVTPVAGWLPNFTVTPGRKWVPLRVTRMPPAVDPVAGETPVMTGARVLGSGRGEACRVTSSKRMLVPGPPLKPTVSGSPTNALFSARLVSKTRVCAAQFPFPGVGWLAASGVKRFAVPWR